MVRSGDVVRPMVCSDLEGIVAIHLESFPGFFLTFLGHDFLALLYQHIQRDDKGIVLVACLEEEIEGFVAGTIRQKGFYQRLIKKYKWAFAGAALEALLHRPSIAPRLIRALRRPAQSDQASAEACLMSIAVRPELEGAGIGSRLVRAFCQELAAKGVRDVCLTTDRDHNDRVNHFYRRLGFHLGRAFVTPEGRVMNEYVISLQ